MLHYLTHSVLDHASQYGKRNDIAIFDDLPHG
jgi:hypothetical protein